MYLTKRVNINNTIFCQLFIRTRKVLAIAGKAAHHASIFDYYNSRIYIHRKSYNGLIDEFFSHIFEAHIHTAVPISATKKITPTATIIMIATVPIVCDVTR